MRRGRPVVSGRTTENAWPICSSSWTGAQVANDLDIPGWRLHPLKGELDGYWSLGVSGNWRVIFRFIGSDIELVDYLDYH